MDEPTKTDTTAEIIQRFDTLSEKLVASLDRIIEQHSQPAIDSVLLVIRAEAIHGLIAGLIGLLLVFVAARLFHRYFHKKMKETGDQDYMVSIVIINAVALFVIIGIFSNMVGFLQLIAVYDPKLYLVKKLMEGVGI